MQHALHLVMNECTNDTRVLRAAEASLEASDVVTILALKRSDVAAEEQRNGFRIRRVAIWTQNWPRVLPVQLVKYLELCLRMVFGGIRMRPTCVHAHDLNMLPFGWVIARLSGARLIYDSHELWSNIHTILAWPAPLRRTVLAIETVLARRADRIITVCDSIADELQQRLSIKNRPAVVRNIPETDLSRTSSSQPPVGLRQAHGLSDDDQVLLYIGWFSPHRGLSLLVEALASLPAHVHLVLVGKGLLLEQLERTAQQLGVASRVHFHGVVPPDQLLQLSQEATVGVVPYEGVTLNQKYCLPNKVFEYIQSGLPLVVSDLPEMRRVVEGYGIGRTFRDRDAGDLAAQLTSFLGSPEALREAIENLQKARHELTWQNERQNIVDVYRELVA